LSRKRFISFIMTIVMVAALFSGITVETKTVKADDGLVLYLPFDNDLKDSSGSGNDAECTNGRITYTDGIFGKAAYFDGKSYIEIVDNPSLDLDNFTISFWANKATKMKWDVIVPYVYKEEDEETWAPPYQIFEFGDNLPIVYLHDNSDDTEMNQFQMEGESIDIRKWFLLTVTYNGSEVSMYEDGVLVRKQKVTGTPSNTVGNLCIGMKDGKYFYQGEMDDLRIYNRGLSSGEVLQLYKDGLNGAENPYDVKHFDEMVAYYKFNDNTKDYSRWGNDAQLAAGKLTYVDGMNGKAAKFTKGTYLEVADNTTLDCDMGFTVTAWINLAKTEEMQTLLNKNGVSTSYSSEDFAYRLHLYEDFFDFDYTPFGWQNGSQGIRYGFDNSIINRWIHLAVTFDTKEVRWYINGKFVQKEEVPEYTGSKLAHSDGNLMIGSDGALHFNGAIDELKLFNYALSAKAVEVEAKKIDSLTISTANQNTIKGMKVNTTATLVANRKYIDTGKTVKLSSGITYQTSNKNVFTVSNKGVIKAVKKGTANLTITHGGISKSYKVTVK
jgi:hypothetical protein